MKSGLARAISDKVLENSELGLSSVITNVSIGRVNAIIILCQAFLFAIESISS